MNRCRSCGCGDFDACVYSNGAMYFACWWVEADLCSFCALNSPGEARVPVRGVDPVPTGGRL